MCVCVRAFVCLNACLSLSTEALLLSSIPKLSRNCPQVLRRNMPTKPQNDVAGFPVLFRPDFDPSTRTSAYRYPLSAESPERRYRERTPQPSDSEPSADLRHLCILRGGRNMFSHLSSMQMLTIPFVHVHAGELASNQIRPIFTLGFASITPPDFYPRIYTNHTGGV